MARFTGRSVQDRRARGKGFPEAFALVRFSWKGIPRGEKARLGEGIAKENLLLGIANLIPRRRRGAAISNLKFAMPNLPFSKSQSLPRARTG